MRAYRRNRFELRQHRSVAPIKSNAAVLAGAIVLALVMATSAQANNYIVNSTADSGPGTLRQAAMDANGSAGPHFIALFLPPGSTITLTSGDIEFTGPDVTIVGLGRDDLTISGNHHSRIFDVQAGSLAISDMTLRDGLALGDTTNPYDQVGGAIRVGPVAPPLPPAEFSALLKQAHLDAAKARPFNGRTRANRSAGLMAIRKVQSLQPQDALPLALTIDRVALLDNRAEAPDLSAGGAISTEAGTMLVLRNSVVSGNSTNFAGGAISAVGGDQYAPGVSVGSVDIRNTIFSGNRIDMNGTEIGQGGAMESWGPAVNIQDSAFRDSVINDAPLDQPPMDGEGAALSLLSAGLPIDIKNSEISGNTVILRDDVFAQGAGLDCYAYAGVTTPVTISNSTISGNQAQTGAAIVGGCNLELFNTTIADNISHGPDPEGHGGDAVEMILNQGLLNAQSTLIANPDTDVDLYFYRGATNVGVVSHSLVVRPYISPGAPVLPADTIIGIDPMLMPLANNGGSTRTQALATGSVAIDAGNNLQALIYDQRGAPYPRVMGVAADIGAYERFVDSIFANGFD